MPSYTNERVKEYCYNTLAKTKTSNNQNKALRTLVVDLLNYGAQSQVYASYNTDKLVTADLTTIQNSWASNTVPTLNSILDIDYVAINNPTVAWTSAGLYLSDSVKIRFTISAESIDNLVATIDCAGKTYDIPSSDFVARTDSENKYYIYFNNLTATQFSEPVYITVYNNDTAVSNTLCYSVESYAYSKIGDGTQSSGDSKLDNLLISLIKYGKSAYDYVTP